MNPCGAHEPTESTHGIFQEHDFHSKGCFLGVLFVCLGEESGEHLLYIKICQGIPRNQKQNLPSFSNKTSQHALLPACVFKGTRLLPSAIKDTCVAKGRSPIISDLQELKDPRSKSLSNGTFLSKENHQEHCIS